MIKEKCFFVTVGNIFNKSRFLCNICKNHAIYEQNLTTKHPYAIKDRFRDAYLINNLILGPYLQASHQYHVFDQGHAMSPSLQQ